MLPQMLTEDKPIVLFSQDDMLNNMKFISLLVFTWPLYSDHARLKFTLFQKFQL